MTAPRRGSRGAHWPAVVSMLLCAVTALASAFALAALLAAGMADEQPPAVTWWALLVAVLATAIGLPLAVYGRLPHLEWARAGVRHVTALAGAVRYGHRGDQ